MVAKAMLEGMELVIFQHGTLIRAERESANERQRERMRDRQKVNIFTEITDLSVLKHMSTIS